MGPPVESALAWIVLPLVIYAVSLGVGLLVSRLLRLDLPTGLVAPLGLCGALFLAVPGYRLNVGAELSLAVIVVVAAVGLVLERRRWRTWLNPGPAGIAALFVYGLYLAPVALAGGWTWTGYNFVNDTAIQFLLIDHLASDGYAKPIEALETERQLEAATTSEAALLFYLRSAYPLGSHALLASLTPLRIAPTAALYAPYIAALLGIATMALATLAARVTGRRVAAGIAFAAAAANLAYAYALQGNVKEVAALACLVAAAAVAGEVLRSTYPARAAVALALCLVALLAVFGAAGLPYVFALSGCLLLAVFFSRGAPVRARVGPALLAGAGALIVGTAIAATELLQSVQVLFEVFADGAARPETVGPVAPVSELGHLLRPLSPFQAAGIWLAGDYRVPVEGDRSAMYTTVLIVLMLLAAAIGVVWLVRRRLFAPLLLVGPAILAAALVGPFVSPYAGAKLIAIASPAIVLIAGLGVAALATWRRLPAAVVAVALLVGVLLSDAHTYHDIQLAPVSKMQSLEEVAERYSDRGDLLLTENEEFGKYFLREAANVVEFDSVSPRQAQLTNPESTVGQWFDLDLHRTGFVNSFPYIVQRRSPVASRPPATFALDWENDHYRVWRRRGGMRVIEHMPVQGLHRGSGTPSCAQIARIARRSTDGQRLVAALRPATVQLDTAVARRSPGWLPHPFVPETVDTRTPGSAYATATLDEARYRVWIRGGFGRPVEARMDDRRLGDAVGVETPGQWQDAGVVSVRPGRHRLELRRGGGNLEPGDGYRGVLGPLALEPVGGRSLRQVDPERFRALCGLEIDWLERVAPGEPVSR